MNHTTDYDPPEDRSDSQKPTRQPSSLGIIADFSSPASGRQPKAVDYNLDSSLFDPAKALAFEALSPREKRFYLQAQARELLPDEKVADCLRHIAPHKLVQGVDIMKSKVRGTVRLRNLVVCGSVTSCAVCAARITEQRREEVMQATVHGPYQPVLITLTLRHKLADPFVSVRNALMNAWADTTSGKQWLAVRDLYGWVGFIRSLEVTHGDHGWHPHLHILAFLLRRSPVVEIDGLTPEYAALSLQTDLRQRWLHMAEKHGFDANWQHGVRVETADSRIKDYILKYGHEPINVGWTIERELTKGPAKVARDADRGRTPFQLLYDFSQGDIQAGNLFKEYFYGMKDTHPFKWSKGLRQLLGLGPDQSDETLADAPLEDEFVYSNLTAAQWRAVLHLGSKGHMMNKAEFYSESEEFKRWLWQYLRRCRERQKARQKTVNATEFMWSENDKKGH